MKGRHKSEMEDKLEKKQKSRQDASGQGIWFWIFAGAGIFCLAVGGWAVFFSEGLKRNLLWSGGYQMMLETAAIFLWMLVFACRKGKRQILLGGMGAGILAAAWLHQVFLPFIGAGLWLFTLLMLGQKLRRSVGKSIGKGDWLFCLTSDLLLGCGLWIVFVCLASAFGTGGAGRFRRLAVALFLILAVWSLAGLILSGTRRRRILDWLREAHTLSRQEGACLAVMVTMMLVQLARINLWPDFDSLHYGLRSLYILDNGQGIYEDLGNVNLVYTYPKGFEILTLPLSGTATFGYTLCFNLWLTILVFVLVFGLTRQIRNSRLIGFYSGAFVALVPGVTNMAITAKSDTMTLVCQMGILCSSMGIIKARKAEEKWKWFGIAAGSCFLSYGMKPTAVVFSTVLALACLVFLLVKGSLPKEMVSAKKIRGNRGFLAAALSLGFGAWAGTWIRTYRMTGVPATSVFTAAWEKLGFHLCWPYGFLEFMDVPDQGLEMNLWESLWFLIKRLYHILAAPTGEDMAHVVIAWGTSSMVMFFWAWLFWGRRLAYGPKGSRMRDACLCLYLADMTIGAFSLLSVYLLWQVDGNYFMLMYVLLAVTGAISLEEMAKDEGLIEKKWKKSVFSLLSGSFFLFQAAVTLSVNWSGSVGFTPIQVKNPGYYNHQQLLYEQKSSQGSQAIWSILAQDPRNRVLAMGEHPQVLLFPCCVQSYYDLTGNGGNPRLAKTPDHFKEFLRYARIDYLYVEAGYVAEETKAYNIIFGMVGDGTLADIRYEHGNMLARINLDGEYPVEPEYEMERLYQNLQLMETKEAGN